MPATARGTNIGCASRQKLRRPTRTSRTRPRRADEAPRQSGPVGRAPGPAGDASAASSTTCPAPASRFPDLDAPHDPDWWLKSLIERERITGVLPPALALRTEDAAHGRDPRPRDHRRMAYAGWSRTSMPDRSSSASAPGRPSGHHSPARRRPRDRRLGAAPGRRVAQQKAVMEQIRRDEAASAPPPWWRRLLARLSTAVSTARSDPSSVARGTLGSWSRHRRSR